MTRLLLSLALTLAVGCADRPSREVQPLQVDPSQRARPAEPPPPEIVQPHLNRRELTEAERRERERLLGPEDDPRGGGGGGGGFGDRAQDWQPRVEERAHPRDVDALTRRLGQQMEGEVDPEDDACEQWHTLMQATEGQMAHPGEPPAAAPARDEMRAACAAMPEAMRRCFDQSYFREHQAECLEQIEGQARRGQRITDRARERVESGEAGFTLDDG
ncbi:MAG TPA: hypothetical protein DEF51_34000 [Myxococcales bacterium]|nr:hypothetical protein [Myxococcales bacterium]